MRAANPRFVALCVVFAACAEDPAAPVALTDDVVAQLAEEVAADARVTLPSLPALLAAAREAIVAQGGNEVAIGHFRRAARLRNAAVGAQEAGDATGARALSQRGAFAELVGVVTALGPRVADRALAGAVAGLARMEAALAGREPTRRVAAALDRIRADLTAARSAQASGDAVSALLHAIAAADGIRSLSPAHAARTSIARATELLRSARQAVGDSASEEEARALRAASRYLELAGGESAAGRLEAAAKAAESSVTLSWGVIQGRVGAGR